MSELDEILAHNAAFVRNREYETYTTDKYPNRQLAVLTCMDTRLIELLPAALGLRNGDAKIIKNAGAMVTHPFGSVMRSLLVAVYQMHVCEILVVGHGDCGMQHMDAEPILRQAREAGVTEEALATLQNAGIDLDRWLAGFDSVEASVQRTVEIIEKHPLMPPAFPVHGLIIDPHTGALRVISHR